MGRTNLILKYGNLMFKAKSKLSPTTKLGLYIIPIFLVIVILTAVVILIGNNNKVRIDTIESLQTSLISTHKNIKDIWVEGHIIDATFWAKDPILIKYTNELLAISSNRQALINSQALGNIRNYFTESLKQHDALGIFIIGPDYISIASMRDSNTGTINFIAKDQRDRLEKVFNGIPQLITPLISDIPLKIADGKTLENLPSMFVAAPIIENEKIIAALCIRIDPMGEFSLIPKAARIGISGESYIFDKKGMLISESRFIDDLVQVGLIKDRSFSILQVRVCDPGGNLLKGFTPNIERNKQAFTHAVQQALNNQSTYSTKAYRDYRGVLVLGAWLWDTDLDIGFIVEIDEHEALEPYRATQLITILLLLFIIFLTFSFTQILLRSQRRAIYNIQQREKYLQTILNGAVDAIITINEKGIIENFNQAAEQIFQYDAEEAIGQNIKMIINIHDNKHHDQYIKNYIDSGNAKVIGTAREVLGIKKDGKIFPLRLAVSEILIGNERKFVGILSDLEESKKKTAELEKSRNAALSIMQDANTQRDRAEQASKELKKFSLAIEESPISVIITNNKGVIEYANPKFTRISGYEANEAIGKKPNMFTSGIQSDEFLKKLWETILKGHEWKGEFLNKKKDGETFWESASISSITNEEKQITQFILISEDITEKKQADQELQKRANELETINKIMLDREMRVIEMKEEVNKLAKELGKEQPYPELWKESKSTDKENKTQAYIPDL